MKPMPILITLVLIAIAAPACGADEDIVAGKCKATLTDGGFLGRVSVGQYVIVDETERDDFRAVVLDRFEPSGEDEAGFAPVLGRTTPADVSVTGTRRDGDNVTRRVAATAGDVSAEFIVTAAPVPGSASLKVTCRVKLRGNGLVSAVGLAQPR